MLFLLIYPNLEDPLSPYFSGEDFEEFHNNVRLSLMGQDIDGFQGERLIPDEEVAMVKTSRDDADLCAGAEEAESCCDVTDGAAEASNGHVTPECTSNQSEETQSQTPVSTPTPESHTSDADNNAVADTESVGEAQHLFPPISAGALCDTATNAEAVSCPTCDIVPEVSESACSNLHEQTPKNPIIPLSTLCSTVTDVEAEAEHTSTFKNTAIAEVNLGEVCHIDSGTTIGSELILLQDNMLKNEDKESSETERVLKEETVSDYPATTFDSTFEASKYLTCSNSDPNVDPAVCNRDNGASVMAEELADVNVTIKDDTYSNPEAETMSETHCQASSNPERSDKYGATTTATSSQPCSPPDGATQTNDDLQRSLTDGTPDGLRCHDKLVVAIDNAPSDERVVSELVTDALQTTPEVEQASGTVSTAVPENKPSDDVTPSDQTVIVPKDDSYKTNRNIMLKMVEALMEREDEPEHCDEDDEDDEEEDEADQDDEDSTRDGTDNTQGVTMETTSTEDVNASGGVAVENVVNTPVDDIPSGAELISRQTSKVDRLLSTIDLDDTVCGTSNTDLPSTTQPNFTSYVKRCQTCTYVSPGYEAGLTYVSAACMYVYNMGVRLWMCMYSSDSKT